MKKKMSLVLVAVMLLSVLSGCRVYTDFTVNSDGTTTSQSRVAYTEEEMKELGDSQQAELTLQTMEDGKQYYVSKAETDTRDSDVIAEENGFVLTGDIFYYNSMKTMEEAGITEDDIYMQMSITLLNDIVDTNADLKMEGKKAVFSSNNKNTQWYAYTKAGKTAIDTDRTAPKMKGAKNGRYYKKMPEKVRFVDNTAVKKVVFNGKEAASAPVTEQAADGKTEIISVVWSDKDGNDASRNGKNVCKVTDLNGNTAKYIFYIDPKAPIIKGVKKDKTYEDKAVVYVKDSRKLAKVTVNGKNQKLTKKKLVKKGKYKGYYKYTVKKAGENKIVAKDAAGNKRAVTFMIEK